MSQTADILLTGRDMDDRTLHLREEIASGLWKMKNRRGTRDQAKAVSLVESGEVHRKCRKLAGEQPPSCLQRQGLNWESLNQFTYNMAKYFDKVFEPKNIRYKTHRKNKVRLLNFYGDDGDGGDDDIDITQLSGWGIPERPSPSSPSSLGALEGSKHGRSVATGQPAEKPTGPAPNPCEGAGA